MNVIVVCFTAARRKKTKREKFCQCYLFVSTAENMQDIY